MAKDDEEESLSVPEMNSSAFSEIAPLIGDPQVVFSSSHDISAASWNRLPMNEYARRSVRTRYFRIRLCGKRQKWRSCRRTRECVGLGERSGDTGGDSGTADLPFGELGDVLDDTADPTAASASGV